MLSKIKKIIGMKTQIFLLIFICVSFGLFILYEAGKTRAKGFEFTAPDVNSFTNWQGAAVFVLLPPPEAKNIRAVAYPGSGLYNADYILDSNDFSMFCMTNELMFRPIKDIRASSFRRDNNWREIPVGYEVDTIQRDSVTIDIWYDERAQEVLYRQHGFPPSQACQGGMLGRLLTKIINLKPK